MTDLDLEDRLRGRLHDAVDHLSPASQSLDATARLAGGRVRRRRRWTVAATGTAAAAVLLAVTFPLTSGRGSRAVDLPPAAQPTSRTGVATASFPGNLPVSSLPARQVARRLVPLLPPDATVTRVVTRTAADELSPGEDPRITGSVRVDLDRGSSRGGLEVVVHTAPSTGPALTDPTVVTGTSCPAFGYDPAPSVCRMITLPDGRIGRVTETDDEFFVIREVLMSTASGGFVYVATANSLDDKWGCSSPEGECYVALDGPPPVSLDELEAIAEAPVWDEAARASG